MSRLTGKRYRDGRATSQADAIPRINDLISVSKAGWLGLLAYLAFIGVTLIGVEDADFFIVERRTQLPLIGVTIPTTLFFAIAPALGAMLYTYLHLYLLKLWEAVAEAPERLNGLPIGDHVRPWLIADYALSYRLDAPLRERPLRGMANAVSGIFIFLAAPLVLAGFWWRSMPKHDEVLTVIGCGLPLCVTVYVGVASWLRLRRLARRNTKPLKWRRGGRVAWAGIIGSVVLGGWFTTEGTLSDYARADRIGPFEFTSIYDRQHARLVQQLAMLDDAQLHTRFSTVTPYAKKGYESYLADLLLEDKWWMQTPFPELLVPADLSNFVFVETPPDWLPYNEGFIEYRHQACKQNGWTPIVCGEVRFESLFPLPGEITESTRRNWCANQFPENLVESDAACTAIFSLFDERVSLQWDQFRENAVQQLPKRDLSGIDMRRANLSGAQLEGADLTSARLDWANLNGASMSEVDFRFAQLRGAELSSSFLDGATLLNARMEGVQLRAANMERAYLRNARMEGAELSGAFFSESTNWEGALVHGSSAWGVDFTITPISADQVTSIFGDGTTTLPDNIPRPAHWPKWEIPWKGENSFNAEWDKWRADPARYVPPPSKPE